MKIHLNYLNRLLLTLSLLLFSATGYSQLTSVEATVYLDSGMVQINDTFSIERPKFFATVTPDDLDDLGKISVVIYFVMDGSVVCDEIVKTKEELISEGLIEGNSFVLELCPYFEGYDYHLVFSPETLTGAFVEILDVYYPL